MKYVPSRRKGLPPVDFQHGLSDDGRFYFDEPGDRFPTPDTTIPRLPLLSGLGTRDPERRFRILASDTYSRNVFAETDAPSTGLVFQETRNLLKDTRYTRFEVTDITPRIRGVNKR